MKKPKPDKVTLDRRPKKKSIPKLSWKQSTIIKAAAICTAYLLASYTAGVLVSVQGMKHISEIAYDQNVSKTLDEFLTTIKEVHSLRKDLVIENLNKVVDPEFKYSKKPVFLDNKTIQQWLKKAEFERITPASTVKIDRIKDEVYDPQSSVKFEWKNQKVLRLLNYEIEIPKSAVEDYYRNSEKVSQGYKATGLLLDEKIKPQLVLYYSGLLFFSILILLALFFQLGRNFKRKLDAVMSGFQMWSINESYRFPDTLSGELGLITRQFNIMADEVESNKQRTLYLEKIASWQTIARKMAHEIKNPLTPIQMMVSQLHRKYPGDDEKFKKLLDNAQKIIIEEVSGLRRMVDNFSEFAQLPLPKTADHNIVEVVEGVVTLQQAAFENHRIEFKSDIEKVICHIDDHLIRQVLINLIKNAAEARGEKPSEITATVSVGKDAVLIYVDDNGPGIPKDIIGQIFEAYFTTKHSGDSPGMGLGLAVCRKILLDHGGKLLVKSEPGATRFTMMIPKSEHAKLPVQ
jgi:signal transduction histidine kinase